MNKTSCVLELLKWRSKAGVSEDEMVACVDAMTTDLRELRGFLHQTLYKTLDDEWIDVYYWRTDRDVHKSDTTMADKPSLRSLLELIEDGSFSMQVMPSLQSSGEIAFGPI